MKDVCQNFHQRNLFSVSANPRCQDKLSLQSLILGHLRKVGGLTCEELEERLGLSHQTCSARIADLKRLGQVVVSGRRKTNSGKWAGVNQALPE